MATKNGIWFTQLANGQKHVRSYFLRYLGLHRIDHAPECEQERAELAEQIAAVQRDLDATPIDNMPRRGRLTWTIRRGGEAPGRDRRSARARPPMTARLALIGAALLLPHPAISTNPGGCSGRGRPQRAALLRCA